MKKCPTLNSSRVRLSQTCARIVFIYELCEYTKHSQAQSQCMFYLVPSLSASCSYVLNSMSMSKCFSACSDVYTVCCEISYKISISNSLIPFVSLSSSLVLELSLSKTSSHRKVSFSCNPLSEKTRTKTQPSM